jgi:hypothetical protein
MFSFILFRSQSVEDAFEYFRLIGNQSLLSAPVVSLKSRAVVIFLFIFLMLSIEWFNRDKDYALAEIGQSWSRPIRWFGYFSGILLIFFLAGRGQSFIYVQF